MPILSTPPGAPKTATYVTISAEGQLTAERVLTGTSNQIVITDNGANSTVVLSTPQNIHTGATPTFSTLTITNSIVAGTYLRVGSTSAPTNTTAGDLTATRISIGNSAAFSQSTGEFVQMTGTMTDTSGGASAYMFVNASTIPASNSTTTFQGINFLLTHVPAAGVTTTGVVGGNFAVLVHTTGAITTAQGFLGNCIQVQAGATNATATITTAQAVVALPGVNSNTGTTTSITVTTMTGFDMNLGLVGNSTWTITSLYGLRVSDLLATGNTITTFSGIQIDKLTKGTTNTYGARINQPGLANGVGTTTDSIAIFIPTATINMGNQTATTTNAYGVLIGQATYTSTTNTRTITTAVSLYVAGPPVASTNVTFSTTAYALWVDAGPIRLDSTTANNTTATILGSVGPAGANTTVQEWLTIDINGTTRYLPCF